MSYQYTYNIISTFSMENVVLNKEQVNGYIRCHCCRYYCVIQYFLCVAVLTLMELRPIKRNLSYTLVFCTGLADCLNGLRFTKCCINSPLNIPGYLRNNAHTNL